VKKRFEEFWDYFLFGIVYFVQGALALTAVAMPLFLRDLLSLTIPQITTLTAIAAIPWTLKPLYGFVTDYYPIRGLKRKPYLLIMSLLASFGWLLTAFTGSYWTVLFAQICAALGIAATDVVADGLAVQKSTPKTKGKIQAVCWGGRSLGAVIAGFTGGYLLNYISTQSVFAITAVLPLLTFGAVFFVHEKKSAPPVGTLGSFVKKIVKTYVQTKLLWWVALFLFIWYVSPSFGVPLFFYMKDTLGMSETFLGVLRSTSNVGGLLGAFLFWKMLDKVSPKKLFVWLILINAGFTLLFYLVLSATSALAVYFVNGMLGIIIVIASMKLIVSVCPKGIEATTFALVTGITNLASIVVATYIGGQLYALIGYKPLILVSAVIGLVPLLLIGGMFKAFKREAIR